MVQVKDRVEWIGDQTIHLGDSNVPNALMFIDKYNQVTNQAHFAYLSICTDQVWMVWRCHGS